MADATLTIKIAGDSKDAQDAVQHLRQTITNEVQKIGQVFQAGTTSAGAYAAQLRAAFGGSGGGGLQGAASSIAGLAGTTTLATAAFGALVAVGVSAVSTLIDIANSASAYASKIQDAHEQTTFTVESLQLLQAVGAANGVTFEQVTNSISQFQDRLAQATEGNKKLSTEFKNLGINIQAAADEPEKAFFQLLTTLGNVENAVERTALAKDLLGKSGVRLLRILGDLTAGGADFKTELQSIGVILRGEDIAALDEFGDEWDRVKLTAQGAINLIAKEFIPTLIVGIQDGNDELKSMRDLWPRIGIAANEFFRDVIVGAKELKFEVGAIVDGLKNIFVPKLRSESFTEVIERMTVGAKQIGAGIKGDTTAIGAEFDKQVQELRDKLKKEQDAEEASQGKRRGLLANHVAKQKTQQDKAADNAIKAIERENKEIDRVYADTVEKIRQNFEARLETEQSFTEKLIFETDTRRAQLIVALNKEADIVRSSKLAQTTKDDRLDKIGQQLIDVNREADKKIEAARFASFERIKQAQIELERARLDTQREADTARIAVIQSAIDDEVLTREQGEQRISVVVLAEIDRRIAAQEDEIRRVFVNEEQRRIAEERLAALRIQRNAAEAAAARLQIAARRDDLASLRAFDQESQRIGNSVAQLEAQFRGTFASRQIDVIREIQAAQERAVLDEFAIRKKVFDEEIELLNNRKTTDEAEQQGILRRKQEIAQRELELEAEKNAKLKLIQRQGQVDAETADPNSFRSEFGGAAADNLDAIGAKVTAVQQIFSGFRAKVAADMNAVGQSTAAPLTLIGGLLGKVTAGFTQTAIAALASGQSIGASAKAAAAGVLLGIAQIAGAEAVKNLAYGFNAIGWTIFTADPKGAAAASSYFTSAALWGSLALGSALGAGAINRSGSNGGGAGGSGGSPTLAGTRQDDNTRSTEERIRFRESGALRPVTTIVIQHETGLFVSKVETALRSSYQNDGTAKKIIDNANSGRPI